MIPNLLEALAKAGISPVFVALAFAATLTAAAFLAQSLAGWFEDWDS